MSTLTLYSVSVVGVSALATTVALLWGYGMARRLKAPSGSRLLLTGGGTAGHVNPALAIAEAMLARKPDIEVHYVGVAGRTEAVVVPKVGYPMTFIHARGYPGLRPSVELLRFCTALLAGMAKAFFVLAAFQPTWIVATGGFVSAPVIFTHALMRRLGLSRARVFIHEQNSVPGKLNTIAGRFADKVFLTFPGTQRLFPDNGLVVGYPVRKTVECPDAVQARSRFPVEIPKGAKVVFAFGGSQGARTINRAVVDALAHLEAAPEPPFVIHGTGVASGAGYDGGRDTQDRLRQRYGAGATERFCHRYFRKDYFHNIGEIYALADIVVCRSGAGSLNELSHLGLPAILIPKQNLPADHQVMNALAMHNQGAAEVLFEKAVIENDALVDKVTGKQMSARILELLSDESAMLGIAARSKGFLARGAAGRIAREIIDTHTVPLPKAVAAPLPAILSNRQLLQRLGAAAGGQGNGLFDPRSVISDAEELAYYRCRAAGLLLAPGWESRNLGVKLAGLLLNYDQIPMLVDMLVDTTPASPLQRLFGGDYRQVGFIRRNVLTALQMMDQWSEPVERAVLTALDDRYYEVAANAAVTAGHFSDRLHDPTAWSRKLAGLLGNRHPEIVEAAARALGAVGSGKDALQGLLSLAEHSKWQCRHAGLQGITALLGRGAISANGNLSEEIARFILTATDFRPYFAIKDTYVQLCREVRRQSEAARSSQHESGAAAAREAETTSRKGV